MGLPTTIFVRQVEDEDATYLVAEEAIHDVVPDGEQVEIGIYELRETKKARLVVEAT